MWTYDQLVECKYYDTGAGRKKIIEMENVVLGVATIRLVAIARIMTSIVVRVMMLCVALVAMIGSFLRLHGSDVIKDFRWGGHHLAVKHR